ncbi:MAG: hypothetical protein U0105_14910 [Candidatus Obscuribacterales bacterium]|jgi:hypothetical protein
MSVKHWGDRELLKRKLAGIASRLTLLKTNYAASGPWSRMIGNRIQSSFSKYWKAVEALTEDDLDFAGQQIAVCALEAGFIEKLMEAETAERELGEGEFFEFSGSNDEMKKIERDVNKLKFELQSVLSEVRRLRRGPVT